MKDLTLFWTLILLKLVTAFFLAFCTVGTLRCLVTGVFGPAAFYAVGSLVFGSCFSLVSLGLTEVSQRIKESKHDKKRSDEDVAKKTTDNLFEKDFFPPNKS